MATSGIIDQDTGEKDYISFFDVDAQFLSGSDPDLGGWFYRPGPTVSLIFSDTTGTGATTYSPADVVTREQMAAFLARMWDLLNPEDPPAESLELQSFPTPDPYPFDDIDPSSFAYGAIAQISQLGITTGTSEMTYSPTDDVTREQMAAFLARLYRAITA